MYQILIPSTSAADWKQFLGQPDRHWKDGRSAKMLAESWESNKTFGFPPEVAAIFDSPSSPPNLGDIIPLLAIPEHKVALPGGRADSQTDVFALARDAAQKLVSIAVEGKVTEPFGPQLGEWKRDASDASGKPERLAFILKLLGLPQSIPDSIRYQLLHRTASAVVEAKRFNASTAVMLVHSFCPQNTGFEDFVAFVELFGLWPNAAVGELKQISTGGSANTYVGWVRAS